jgi:hypothetical protein
MKNRDRTTDDTHRRRREAGDEDDRDGKEVARTLYGGLTDREPTDESTDAE